jgi:hypothetical protein
MNIMEESIDTFSFNNTNNGSNKKSKLTELSK